MLREGWSCTRCGARNLPRSRNCGTCKLHIDAPAGFTLPEHDAPTFRLVVEGVWLA